MDGLAAQQGRDVDWGLVMGILGEFLKQIAPEVRRRGFENVDGPMLHRCVGCGEVSTPAPCSSACTAMRMDPCDPRCPAVTGEPYGSVTVCPMNTPEDFDKHRAELSDCCIDFRCCMDIWQEAGLVGTADQLAAAMRDAR